VARPALYSRGRPFSVRLLDPSFGGYHEEGILQITPGLDKTNFTDDPFAAGWKTVCRTCGPMTGRASSTRLLADHYKARTSRSSRQVALPAGTGRSHKESMNKAGLNEVMYEAITAGGTGLHGTHHEDETSQGRRHLLRGYHPEAALIVKPGSEQGSMHR